MQNNISELISKFTKIKESKIKDFLKENDLVTLLENPETINPTQNQLKNFKDLRKLNNIYKKLENYKEYKFDNTLDTIPFLHGEFKNKYDKEHFVVMFLDDENKLLGTEKISTGTLSASIVHPRDVMKQAIQYDSNRMILSHNHPSGNPIPSDEDFNIIKRLEEVAKLLDKKIIDHIIVGRESYYSFKEEGDLFVDYEIQNTKNNTHLNIYKKDIKKQIDLLNKFTNIPKTKLKIIFKNNSVQEFYRKPEKYLEDQNDINKINMLKTLEKNYKREASVYNMELKQISSPFDIENYVMTKYDNYDNINIAMFLNTKNQILKSEILPNDLSEKEEAKYLMEKSIIYNSNSFILSTKTTGSKGTQKNIERIQNLKNKSDLIGIRLLDNIDLDKNKALSYKGINVLENKVKYKTKTKSKKPKKKTRRTI